jgi:hypothetical protein
MVTSEERLRILKMIQDGKISAEEGIQLMDVLSDSRRQKERQKPPVQDPMRRGSRFFRVRVTDRSSGKIKVDIRLPINVVRAGSKLGARFSPEMTGLDMDQVMEYVESGATGRIFELTHDSDQELIEVFIE